MKKILKCMFILILICGCYASQTSFNKQEGPIIQGEKAMRKIQITIHQEKFEVELENNSTAEELLKRLPMILSLKDLNNNEKYNYLKQSLPTHTQNVYNIETGDVMLFGDNCLVVFYKSFETSYQYTKIGKIIDAGHLEEALGSNDVSIEFKICEK